MTETPRKPQETILDLLTRARVQSENNLKLAIKRRLPEAERDVRKRLRDLDHAIYWTHRTMERPRMEQKTQGRPITAPANGILETD